MRDITAPPCNINGQLDRDELAHAFLHRVLPPEGSGLYCLWVKHGSGRGQNVFADTIGELWEKIREYDRDSRVNVYFALAAFTDNSSRKAENATALRAFIADIDIGPDKGAKGSGYATPEEAVKAFEKFRAAVRWPKPVVVSSGHGVHLYWPLTEPLPAAKWRRLAGNAKHLFKVHGLRADPAVTADAAGVLRVPGTTNRKNGLAAAAVTMTQDFLGVGPYELETFLPALNSFACTGVVIRPDFGRPPDYLKAVAGRSGAATARAAEPFPLSRAEMVAEGCAQIAHMRDERGAMPEPEWHHCISVLARCEDGERFCHEWSDGDERYDRAETQKKIDRALRETTGPTKCETFAGLNARCEGCPHWGSITSPIELGRMANPAVAPAPVGMKWVLGQGGRIRERNYPNAMTAIAALGIECRHDVFHDKKVVAGDMTDNLGPELSDTIARAVRERIIEQFGFDPGKDNVQEGLEWACERVRFDPMVDYFAGIEWDGRPRLDQWLPTYLGAEDTPLNRAFGRKTLMAAVRRVRQPGCKFDFMLVLEGPQGIGKSTALKVLAGGDENFSDQKLDLQDPKMQQEAVSGIFIYEIAELESTRKAEVETVKTFLSRTSDNIRPAYARFRVDRPRRCIFIGTTNAGKHDGYLQDPSGNRRF